MDFRAGVVRLDPNTTKNTEGRTFPFAALPALAALLEAQREYTKTVEKATRQMVPLVFHRNGKPVKSYRHGWQAACERAATSKQGELEAVVRPQLLGRVVHDFRRTAVRNLVRAGVYRSGLPWRLPVTRLARCSTATTS